MASLFNKGARVGRSAGDRTANLRNAVFFNDAYRNSGRLSVKGNNEVSVANGAFRFNSSDAHMRFARGLYDYAEWDASNIYVRNVRKIRDVTSARARQDLSGLVFDILYTSNDAMLFLDTENVTVNEDGSIVFGLRSNIEGETIASVDGVAFTSSGDENYFNYMPRETAGDGSNYFTVDLSYGIVPSQENLNYAIGEIDVSANRTDITTNIDMANVRSLFPNSSDPSGVYKFGIVNDFMNNYFDLGNNNRPVYTDYGTNISGEKEQAFAFPIRFNVNEAFS